MLTKRICIAVWMGASLLFFRINVIESNFMHVTCTYHVIGCFVVFLLLILCALYQFLWMNSILCMQFIFYLSLYSFFFSHSISCYIGMWMSSFKYVRYCQCKWLKLLIYRFYDQIEIVIVLLSMCMGMWICGSRKNTKRTMQPTVVMMVERAAATATTPI